jgi:hypothetical protein
MQSTTRKLTGVLCLALVVGSWAAPARASTSALQVEVLMGPRAKIGPGGAAARLPVEGICTSGAEVLEAFAYITQDGHTTSMGSFPLVCDGTRHRWLVEVRAFDAPLHPGAATASAYALVTNSQTGDTADDSPFRDITLFA